MTINRIPSVGGAGGAAPIESGKEKFGKVLGEVSSSKAAHPPQGAKATPPIGAPERAESASQAVAGKSEVDGLKPIDSVQSARMQQAVKMVDEVNAAQNRLDQILAMAESGRTFSPAELLAFQAHVQRASQELDLAGKVIDKVTSGVKQVLQTQV